MIWMLPGGQEGVRRRWPTVWPGAPSARRPLPSSPFQAAKLSSATGLMFYQHRLWNIIRGFKPCTTQSNWIASLLPDSWPEYLTCNWKLKDFDPIALPQAEKSFQSSNEKRAFKNRFTTENLQENGLKPETRWFLKHYFIFNYIEKVPATKLDEFLEKFQRGGGRISKEE